MKKKMLIILAVLALMPRLSHADFINVAQPAPRAAATPAPTVNFPTSAANSYLGDQVIVTLINHGSFSEEYRKGQKQVILSDNIVEMGHVDGQYALALDASLYQVQGRTSLDYEAGLRLNLHAIVNKYVKFTPQWQAIVGNLEYYPRVGYDFGQDHTHAWIATFNFGIGFGPGAGIAGQ